MSEDVRIIKKYPNRRLYDTTTSSYITLEDVKKLVLDHIQFKVEDAKTKEDLTRAILLQIILEEESGEGAPMFSSDALSQIIRFYGNAMQGMMGNYLEKNIHTFIEIQKKLQQQSSAVLQVATVPVRPLVEERRQELGKQITVCRVELHPVKARTFCPRCCLTECRNYPINFGN